MSDEYGSVDIWVGKFGSRKALEAYLETKFVTEDETECAFARDQGIDSLDEDFLESSFHRTTSKFKTLVKDHSFFDSYQAEAGEAFKELGLESLNSIVLVFDNEIETPVSVETSSHSLTYLGRFACDTSSPGPGDSGPAYAIFLILDEGELFYDEYLRKIIMVDPRGLCIGRRSDDANMPCLDISKEVPDVADMQAKIYRDQFDQWVLEDVAGNGLTLLNGNPLNRERALPWQGRKLSIGPIQFTWSTRPKL